MKSKTQLITILSSFIIGFNLHSDTILPNIYLDQIHVGNLTKQQAIKLLNKRYENIDPLQIVFEFEGKKIAVINTKNLDYKLPIQNLVDQAFLVGRGHGISAFYQQLALRLGWESYNFEINPQYNKAHLQQLLSGFALSYKKEPTNARFEFANNKVNAFEVEQDGYEPDITNVLTQIETLLKQQRFEPKTKVNIKIPKKILKAEIKLKDINNWGIKELVGSGSSLFAGSGPERIHNIVNGAGKINGIIIKPGQVFSFNKFLNDISSRNGFIPAFVIKNGKTVLDDGGGICQVSTTLFRAALNAGVPIIERTAHAYRVGYYEQDAKPGLDATIYLPEVDFRFKNDYASALLIQSEVDLEEMKLVFNFYGTKDGRQVQLSDISMWNISSPPEPEYIDDFTLPAGVVKQVDFAAWGASTKFTYRVIYKDGSINEQEFVSNFRPWKAVYLVGKKT